jgi:SAM-dependent methyltransferase
VISAADLPSPVDFHDAAQAQRWVEDTVARRPERPAFFAAFVTALQSALPAGATVLELGSGPGHLAEQVLRHVPVVARYDLLDFSTPMLALARERLARWSSRTRQLQRDFKQANWAYGLGRYDAVLTMQAVHELRHKQHVAALYAQVQTLLRPGGLFLVCDHYAGGSLKNKHPDLFFTRAEQPQVLAAAGFEAVERLFEGEELALYRAVRPSA